MANRPFSRQKSLRRPPLDESKMDSPPSPARSSLEEGVPLDDIKPDTPTSPSSASYGHMSHKVSIALMLGAVLLLVSIGGGLGIGLKLTEEEGGAHSAVIFRSLKSQEASSSCSDASASKTTATKCSPPSGSGALVSPSQIASGNSTSPSIASSNTTALNLTWIIGGNYTGPANMTNVKLPLPLNASLGDRVFHITAIRGPDWDIPNHTPTEMLAILGRMRTALGSPFSLYNFFGGQPANGSALIGNYTLDDYLLLVQQAAGGYIIPALNLDFYTNPFNNSRYPCADGTVGPQCFWQISDQMLSLKAIAMGPRVASLGAWMTFNRCAPNPANCTPADVQSILSQLRKRGWRELVPANIGPFNPTYGLAGGVVAGVNFPNSPPWLLPAQDVITEATQVPNITKVFVYIDWQTQVCPKQSAMDQFLANLTATQKAIGLTNMAKSQASGNFTFIYPIWVTGVSNKTSCNNHNQNPGYWDATTSLQANRTAFFDLIMNLVRTYN